jgi:hypothetical protein
MLGPQKKTIFVQQDNAKPHILPNDQEFKDVVAKIGMDIQLVQQPTNSPDLNVNDLGFFNSIESLTDRRSPRTLNDLIRDVQEEFAPYMRLILLSSYPVFCSEIPAYIMKC